MTPPTLPWWLKNKILAWALVIGLLLRIAVVVWFPVLPTIVNTWDSNFYHETATSLANGDGYTFQGKPTAFFPPGFSFVLTPAYALLGSDPKSGQIMNLLISCLLALTGILLAHRLWGNVAARWTCLIFALEPSQILMPAFLMSEVLCGALVLGVLFWSLRLHSFRGILVASVLSVCAGMTRGHGFLILPAAITTLWFLHREDRTRYLRAFLVVLVITGASVTLWAYRNQSQLGHPVLIATNAGITLLMGNNPNARGGRADPPGGRPQTGDEIRDGILAKEMAMTYIKKHPLRTLGLAPLKIARLWTFGPAVTYREELKQKLPKILGVLSVYGAQASHLILLILVAIGVVRKQSSILLWMVLGAWTMGHLPFVGGARYLFPVHGILILLASYLLAGTEATREQTSS